MNPYGQGQWQQQGSSAPSIFGALPSAPAPRPAAALQPDSVTFQLANFKTTVLNCTVYGPGQRAAFRIVTESAPAACTIIQDNECRNIAMVKWGAHAQVEVRGYAAEQRARDWLKLSSDQSRRVMDVRGIEYAWAPMDGFICMYKLHSPAPRVLARVARTPNMITVDITQEALQLHLLEPTLVATVLLSCGANID